MKERVKELPEEKIAGTHWNDADMDRRLKEYRDSNNSEIGDPSIVEFFKKWDIEVFDEKANGEEAQLVEAFKIFIERKGKPFNYMTFDDEDENSRIQRLEEEEKSKDSQKGDVVAK